jgi:hypothetical protein
LQRRISEQLSRHEVGPCCIAVLGSPCVESHQDSYATLGNTMWYYLILCDTMIYGIWCMKYEIWYMIWYDTISGGSNFPVFVCVLAQWIL